MDTKRLMVTAAMATILGGTCFVTDAYGEIVRPVPPSVIVESVQFRQRYPWNGLVDIDAKITCGDANTNLAVYVAAWDNVKDRALTVKTVWIDGDETKNPDLVTKSGTTRVVWDARADNPGEISSDVSVSVQAYVRDMRYLVVDLSGGTNATEFAYSFMADPPVGGWTDEYKTEKLVLRLVPAGTFLMGSPEDEVGRASDETQHKVTLTQPFYMAVFEMTQAQYALLCGGTETAKTPYFGFRIAMRGNHVPYNWLTMSDVAPTSIAGVLRAKTGIGTFDLPTEARWEYACRAGTTTAFNDGSNLLTTSVDWDMNMAVLGSYNGSGTAVVGSYKPNSWGIYDMHGNAAEWCLDGADRNSNLYVYPSTPVIDPIGNAPYNSGDGAHGFVIRGSGCVYYQTNGSYYSNSMNANASARQCRSAYRGYAKEKATSGYSHSYVAGFRICCDANLLK